MDIQLQKDGKLTLSGNIYDLVDKLDKESLVVLADSISVQDIVIKYVGQQILDGMNDNFSCGASDLDGEPEPTSPLSILRREIAKRASEISKQEIKNLEERNKKLKEENSKLVSRVTELKEHLNLNYKYHG